MTGLRGHSRTLAQATDDALSIGYLPETGRDFESRADFNRAWLRALIRAPRIETLRILLEGPRVSRADGALVRPLSDSNAMTRLIRSPLRWVVVVMNLATLIVLAFLHSWQWALGTGLIGLAWAAILFAIGEPSGD